MRGKSPISPIIPYSLFLIPIILGALFLIPNSLFQIAHASTLGSGTATTTLGNTLNTAGYDILGSGSITGSMSASYISGGAIFGANSTQGYYSFKNGATDIMYIDATNARVGIGITNPSFPLEVQSVGANNIALRGRSNAGIDEGTLTWFKNDGTTTQGYIQSNTTSLNIVSGASGSINLQPTSGNVGIGTTGPGALLDVKSTTSAVDTCIRSSAPTDGTAGLIIQDNTDTSAWVMDRWNSGTQLYIRHSNPDVNSMTFLTNGNVGIATTTPAIP